MTYAIVLNKSDLARETPRAWGFWGDEPAVNTSQGSFCSETVWFPKSQCTLQDHSPDTYRLLAPDWLAKKNGCSNTKYDGIERIK